MAQVPHPVVGGAPLLCTGFERLSVGTVGTAFGSVPSGGSADALLMRVEAYDVRYRLDGGTPTATLGQYLATTDGERYYERMGSISAYRFILASGTVNGTVTASYFMVR